MSQVQRKMGGRTSPTTHPTGCIWVPCMHTLHSVADHRAVFPSPPVDSKPPQGCADDARANTAVTTSTHATILGMIIGSKEEEWWWWWWGGGGGV